MSQISEVISNCHLHVEVKHPMNHQAATAVVSYSMVVVLSASHSPLRVHVFVCVCYITCRIYNNHCLRVPIYFGSRCDSAVTHELNTPTTHLASVHSRCLLQRVSRALFLFEYSDFTHPCPAAHELCSPRPPGISVSLCVRRGRTTRGRAGL